MNKTILFQNLPQDAQDELRDAPISAIENGKVIVESSSRINGILHHLYVELEPRSMDENAIIYITQDLQDIKIMATPLVQNLSA